MYVKMKQIKNHYCGGTQKINTGMNAINIKAEERALLIPQSSLWEADDPEIGSIDCKKHNQIYSLSYPYCWSEKEESDRTSPRKK